MRIENRLQLQLWREECKEKHQKEKCRILVCGGTDVWQGDRIRFMHVLKKCRKVWSCHG